MNIPVIGFIPPVMGVEGVFNTFRLGLTLSKRLTPGMRVFLMDEKTKTVFGVAEVVSTTTGALCALCATDGHMNHSEVGTIDPPGAAQRLFALMQRIYGPHIAKEGKKTTVVYLKRIHDGHWT